MIQQGEGPNRALSEYCENFREISFTALSPKSCYTLRRNNSSTDRLYVAAADVSDTGNDHADCRYTTLYYLGL